MKRGVYRNRVGAELTVTGPIKSVGKYSMLRGSTIYEAVAVDDLLGNTHYLVTEESLREATYGLVDEFHDELFET